MQLRAAASAAVPPASALFLYDLSATAASIVLTFVLRFETLDLDVALRPFLPVALLPLIVRPPVRLAFGLYWREWRFASTRELYDIVGSVVVGSVLIVALYGVAAALDVPGANPFPRSFFLIEPLITVALIGGARFMFRMRIENSVVRRRREQFKRTLIYGAGEAGAMLARSAARDPQLGLHIVGYIDDDPKKRGWRLFGHRVYGAIDDLPAVAAKTDATQLLLAMPSRSGAVLRKAAQAGQQIGLEVKTVPPMRDLITGAVQVASPRQISLEDLLQRTPVKLDVEAIAGYLNGASVLVTGGGGSIGAELVRQILTLGPRVLTVIDNHEAALWSVERDAAPVLQSNGVRLTPVIADVRSESAMNDVIKRARPDVVFHAAALKHVPYVELHPAEGVQTNVIGTRNVLSACERVSVERFVLISTDKAVEPSSVMGWTKHIAELLTVEAGRQLGRTYSAVRFGNVLGSSGSLIPLLDRQVDDGLPITITEPDATRFFMTLSEAVILILQSGAATAAGQVYVLDMGDPVRIGDLVDEFVRLKGADPDAVQYQVIGLRPGEKLHEKLFFDNEVCETTAYAGILRATRDGSMDGDRLQALVDGLCVAAANHDDAAVRSELRVWAMNGTNRG